MKSLWFAFSFLACFLGGCGYHAAYGGDSPVRFALVAGPFSSPDPEAVQAALAGARAALSRAGALSSSADYPELVLEVTRVDELAVGIRSSGAVQGAVPLARGSSVGVVARGHVIPSRGGVLERDTGDIRRTETVSQGAEPTVSDYAFRAAVRGAARRAGEAVANRILGIPEPGIDPM